MSGMSGANGAKGQQGGGRGWDRGGGMRVGGGGCSVAWWLWQAMQGKAGQDKVSQGKARCTAKAMQGKVRQGEAMPCSGGLGGGDSSILYRVKNSKPMKMHVCACAIGT